MQKQSSRGDLQCSSGPYLRPYEGIFWEISYGNNFSSKELNEHLDGKTILQELIFVK